MTFYPCSTYMYSPIFHLAKRTATKTTQDTLLCQDVTATTNVDNINITVVTDCCGVIVPCPGELDELDVHGRPSQSLISVTGQVKNEVNLRHVPECFYSRHMKGEFYAPDTKVLLRALYDFCFMHYKIMDGAYQRMCITDIKWEERKSKSLQPRLWTASLSHMSNR